MSERIAIRKKLGCKPFSWLVENIFPNIPIPEEIRDPPPKTDEEKKGNNTEKAKEAKKSD